MLRYAMYVRYGMTDARFPEFYLLPPTSTTECLQSYLQQSGVSWVIHASKERATLRDYFGSD